MSRIHASDLIALNTARRVRLLDAKNQMIGEASIGEFRSHGDSASSDLVEHVESVGDPHFVELVDDAGRVVHRGAVRTPDVDGQSGEVKGLVADFRRILNGGAP
jgi:hypothetical protein